MLRQRIDTMRGVSDCLKGLLREDAGQDLIEYALVAALIGLGALLAMSGLSAKIANSFNNIGSRITTSV
jgi:pilus assembly protein Flp/PilA